MDFNKSAPNNTDYMRWNCHSGLAIRCANCGNPTTIIRSLTHHHHKSTYDMITDYNKTDGLSSTTRKPTGRYRSDHNIHTANIIFTNTILVADKHNITRGTMHSNCRLFSDHRVCKITQRNKHNESKHL